MKSVSASAYVGYSSEPNISTTLTASETSSCDLSLISSRAFLPGYFPKPPMMGFSPWTILPLVTAITWFANFFSLSARFTSSAWSLSIAIALGYPRKSGKASSIVCRELLSTFSPSIMSSLVHTAFSGALTPRAFSRPLRAANLCDRVQMAHILGTTFASSSGVMPFTSCSMSLGPSCMSSVTLLTFLPSSVTVMPPCPSTLARFSTLSSLISSPPSSRAPSRAQRPSPLRTSSSC